MTLADNLSRAETLLQQVGSTPILNHIAGAAVPAGWLSQWRLRGWGLRLSSVPLGGWAVCPFAMSGDQTRDGIQER